MVVSLRRSGRALSWALLFAVCGSCKSDSERIQTVAVSQSALEEARVVPVLGDGYLKQGNPNQNFGGDPTLKLQASGRNRGLLFFDKQAIVSAVGSGALIAAHLELTIDSAPSGWGTSGRLVALHRLLKASDEQHATWNCAVDTWPLNGNTDCSGATEWTMWSTSDPSLHPWQATASDEVLITTGLTGGVSFDVTADVAAILDGTWAGHGFMLKKVEETASGLVEFSSRERTTMPAPRLVLTVVPPADAGPGPVDASTVSASVPLTKDNYIRKGNPNTNHGAALILNMQASGRNRVLVGLDPSTIAPEGPSGEQFLGATVELTIAQNYENWGPDRSVGIHALNYSWTELGATWNCRHDTNTSNVSEDCPDEAWNMFGGAPPSPLPFVLAPTDITLVQSGQTGVVQWDVSHDVACYLAGHAPLPGWIIKKENEGESGHVEFASREAGAPGQLLLHYTTGPGLTVTAADCASDSESPDAGICSPTGADTDCDGDDDDCDGVDDDEYEVTSISCGVGACVATGERSCEAGAVTDHCTPGSPGASDAVCNGVDENCDGAADDGYQPEGTSCGVGACVRTGVSSCVGGAVQPNCTPGAPATDDASCNGIDEDCSSTADEDYVSVQTSCGVGACAAAGATSCVNGTVQDSCTQGAPAGSDATCNGIDDDCNGATDEDYVPVPTYCGIGACAAAGVTSCSEGIVLNSCIPGTPAPSDTTCDGVDDDCNGATDEDYVSLQTSCGVGACVAAGATSCVDGAVQDSCAPGTPASDDVTCDGIDDDCSGEADEDYASLSTSCGIGACAATGATTCVDGLVEDSCEAGAPAPADPSCDGIDNDCSGIADEDYVSLPTSCGVGVCAASGATSCVNGAEQNSCAPGTPAPADVLCNGLDDDCNGASDEDYVSQATTCGIGACASTGATSCVEGEVEDSCEPGTPAADDATCDGIDDNCSGDADEDYLVVPTQCGIGACAAVGHATCQAGVVVNDCAPGNSAVSDVTCNAFDDDCNGIVDEDYTARATTCGEGECESTGVTSCVAGLEHDSCIPLEEAEDDAECDGLDTDCDGTSDEDYAPQSTSCGFGACASTGATSCVNGEVVDSCEPPPPVHADNDCDGVDDDCDGLADDGYTPVSVACGHGVCVSTGVTSCVNGHVANNCQPGEPTGTDANCNGLDEDCDGNKDDAYPEELTQCGAGVCQRHGGTTCQNGQVVTTQCEPGLPTLTADTTCNGLDEDCDVLVDDQFVVLSSTCGLGACASTGEKTCVAGHVVDSCVPSVPGSDANCNDIDDDCDGLTDEDFPIQSTSCGVGPCGAVGETYCYRGIELDSCEAGPAAVNDSQCDGVDNDCDGDTDEDYPHLPTGATCGVGACTRVERQACIDGLPVAQCEPGPAAGSDATCDTSDDDCDGDVDEDYPSQPTTCGNPPIFSGATSCVNGNIVDSCVCTPTASEDTTCDELDDDCDGLVDDDFVGAVTSSTCGTGHCARPGQMQCIQGHQVDVCLPGTGLLDDTSCNLVDDDCDGMIDDDYITLTTVCGLGNCVRTGITLCDAGIVSDSCVPSVPESFVDLCGGGDENCNAATDEDFATTVTHCGLGVCARTGGSSCVAEVYIDDCVPGAPSGLDEAECNGLDDDCDGALDEDFVSDPTACGEPPFDSTGETQCVEGEVIDTCVPCQLLSDVDVTCDGNDDDCDRVTDDEFEAEGTACGMGVCASAGVSACVNGELSSSCVPEPATGTDQNCNGVDEDCDGSADDGYAPVTLSSHCGVGACQRGNLRICAGGSLVEQCVPGTPAPGDATCNGLDDDCDGVVDESYQIQCNGTAVAACVGGSVALTSCVDGTACTVDACLGGACTHQALDCNDGNVCTADSCDAGSGCVNEVLVGATCEDGNLCSGGDTCLESGACVPTFTVDPNDGDPCTIDTCEASGTVTHVSLPHGTSCADGLFCNGSEICLTGLGCHSSAPPVADDGIACTADSCDEAIDAVLHVPNDAACSDGDPYNGLERCDLQLGCVPGTVPIIDDGSECTIDTFDPVTAIATHTPRDAGTACGTGGVCDGASTCLTFTTCGGALTVSTNLSVSANCAYTSINVTSTGTLTANGALKTGSLTIASGRTVTVNGSLVAPVIDLATGTLTVQGQLVAPSVTVRGGALSVGGTFDATAFLLSSGTFTGKGITKLPVFNVSTVSGGTFINDGQLDLDDDQVTIVTAATLRANGKFGADDSLSSLLVDGRLTQTLSKADGVSFRVDGNATVSSSGTIDVSALGLRGGGRDGNPSTGGETYTSTGTVAPLNAGIIGGGSHGGRGGADLSQSLPTYGSMKQPRHLGSGGSSASTICGNGGGRVELEVGGTLTVAGTVLANGGGGNSPSNGVSGGGSGGSIWLRVNHLAGAGTISANGAGGSAGAGGGRVAVEYTTKAFTGSILARGAAAGGSTPRGDGGPGTVYLKELTPTGVVELVIDNGTVTPQTLSTIPVADAVGVVVSMKGGVATLATGAQPASILVTGGTLNLPAQLTMSSVGSVRVSGGRLNAQTLVLGSGALVISGTGTFANLVETTLPTLDGTVLASGGTFINDGQLNIGDEQLTVVSGATLRANGNFGADDSLTGLVLDGKLTQTLSKPDGVSFRVDGNATISSTGTIDVSALGLRGGGRDGNPSTGGETYTSTGTIVPMNVGVIAGGSHGGHGGADLSQTLPTYGSMTEPQHLGSGGSSSSTICGNGGGRVDLEVTGTLTVTGTILANGGGGNAPSNGVSGGGSGGSIWLRVNHLAGTGTISANGGGGSAGAGGGRVAVEYTTKAFTGSVLARGDAGGGSSHKGTGGPGTVYLEEHTPSGIAELIIDNGAVTPQTPSTVSAADAAGAVVSVKGGVATFAPAAQPAAIVVTGGTLNLPAQLAMSPVGSVRVSGGRLNAQTLVLGPGALVINGTGTFANLVETTLPKLDGDVLASGGTFINSGRLNIDNEQLIIVSGATMWADGDFGADDSLEGLVVSGRLTHSLSKADGVSFLVNGNATVSSTGTIDVSALGLRGGSRDGNLSNGGETYTATGTIAPMNAGIYGGGSHGGQGGATGSQSIPTYGSAKEPVHLGSGGSSAGTDAGNGGGRVDLEVTGTLTIAGTILANGGSGNSPSNGVSGGGSGGSIWLRADHLTGAGAISANGGGGSAGGGGGRVAIEYMTKDFMGTVFATGTPAGGSSPQGNGGPGTVYVREPTSNGRNELIVEHVGAAPQTPTPLSVSNVAGVNLSMRAGPATLAADAQPATIVVTGGTLNLPVSFELSNAGELVVSAGTVNAQTVTAASGALQINGTGNYVNSGVLSLPVFDGTVMSAGTFTNHGNVSIDSGALTIVTGSTFFQGSAGVLNGRNVLSSLAVNGTLIHEVHSFAGLELTVTGNATVTGTINLDGRGLYGGRVTGSTSYSGEEYVWDGNLHTLATGTTTNQGGSHGGVGATTGAASYGYPSAPVFLGGGGDASNTTGGSAGGTGGGLIDLEVKGTLTVTGLIRAIGAAGAANNTTGAGAGGSVRIRATTLAGNGFIRANGGAPASVTNTQAPGGGGRVALEYATKSFTGIAEAKGGVTNSRSGGAGTVFERVLPTTGTISKVEASSFARCTLSTTGSIACQGLEGDGLIPESGIGTFTRLSAGPQAACAVHDSGVAQCWGDMTGSPLHREPTERLLEVSVGVTTACGLAASNGGVHCWGDDTSNLLTAKPAGTGYSHVVVGYRAACVRTSGSQQLTCWGDNTAGAVSGRPTTAILGADGGDGFFCAVVATNNSLYCWGASPHGETAYPAGTNFTAVTTGARHACALTTGGAAVCWGDNDLGQATPPSATFTDLSAGPDYTCGVTTAASVVCWGNPCSANAAANPSIDDGNPCTADACDSLTGQPIHTPISGAPCADGGTCSALGQCTPPPECLSNASCSDGDACNGEETCSWLGDCQPGTPPVVSDGDQCTFDICLPATGVTHSVTPGAACTDGSLCTLQDACDAAGVCVGQPIVVPDDADPCTQDHCLPDLGVRHVPTPGLACSDGNACNGDEVCGDRTWNGRFVQLEPEATYLNTGDYLTRDARAHRLSDFGLLPGERAWIRRVGEFEGASSGAGQNLAIVFSTSDVLLPNDRTVRVPGAVIAMDQTAVSTPANISQDFLVTATEIRVQVPPNAVFFFVTSTSTADPGTHADRDGDWGFTITPDENPPHFGCQPGRAPVVDDEDPCTADSCNPGSGVAHTPVTPGSLSCADVDATCGSIDSCGVMLDCGTCTTPEVCGGQAANRCGAPALTVPVTIGVAKGRNVAAFEAGASMVRPPNADAAIADDGLGHPIAVDANPKVFDVDLAGDKHVIDRVAFTLDEDGSVPLTVQIWTSAKPVLDPADFVLLSVHALASGGLSHVLQLAPTRARYVRLVLLPAGVSAAFGGTISRLAVHTRDREGGILSLLEGGAQINRVTTQDAEEPARLAIDFDAQTEWQTSLGAAGEEIVVRLSPQGYPITRIELRSSSALSGQLRTFDLSVSDTTNDADQFTTLLAGTLAQSSSAVVFDVPATDAAYVKLHASDVHGVGSTVGIQELRAYTDALGGATVPFDDLTELDESQVSSRVWNFGDGHTSTDAHPVHTYSTPGTYVASLTVTDTAGRVGVAQKEYRVLPAPTANFEIDGLPVHEAGGVDLTDLSTATSGQTIVQRTWTSARAKLNACTVTGCKTSNTQLVTYAYLATAAYDISGPTTMDLTVVDSQMLSGHTSTPMDVLNVPPTLKATADQQTYWGVPVRIGGPGAAVDDVSNSDRALLYCTWDIGDGSPIRTYADCRNADVRFDHTYAVPGSYVATFTVFDDVGSTVDVVAVEVAPRPTRIATLSLAPTATDGDFEVTAKLYDALLATAPMPGLPLVFEYAGQTVTATTAANGTASAVLHFEQLTTGSLQVSFAGNTLFEPSGDLTQYIVREGDTAPQRLEKEVLGNEGHTFVLGYPQDATNFSLAEDPAQVNPRNVVALYLSARSSAMARVEVPGVGFDRWVPVVPGETTVVRLPVEVRMGPLDFETGPNDVLGATTGIENKGIRVTSDDLVMVQTYESVTRGSSAGTTVLPADRLGTEYLVTAYRNESLTRFYADPRSSMAAVVGVEDDTTVTIVPSADVRPGGLLPQGAPRGVPIEVTLDSLQTLQLVADNSDPFVYEDMTGTEIRSNKPIAVYGGSTCTTIYTAACDAVNEQLPPVRSWGRRFIVRGFGDTALRGDVLRVLASEPGTQVFIDGALYATLDRSEHLHWDIGPNEMHEVTASKPVLVSQFIKSATGFDCAKQDPAMVLVPPVDRYTGEAVVSTPPNDPWDVDKGPVYGNFATLIVPNEHVGSMRLDGEPLTGWRVVGATEFASARVELQPGNHHVWSEVPGVRFGSFFFGEALCDGYVFAGGMRAEPTQPGCVPTVTAVGDGADNDCDGIRDEEAFNGVDDDGDGVRDEDLTFHSHIGGANSAPVIHAQEVGFYTGSPASVALDGYDADRDPLTYSIVGTVPNGITLSGPVLRYSGTTGVGSVNVSVRVSDGTATSAPVTIRFESSNAGCRTAPPNPPVSSSICNDPPFFDGGSLRSQTIHLGQNDQVLFSAKAHAFDLNEHPFVYSAEADVDPVPLGFQIDPVTGVVQWLVTEADVGQHTFRIVATDKLGDDEAMLISLTVDSQSDTLAPVITSQPVLEATPGTTYAYAVQAHDPDSTSPLTFSLVASPPGMIINAIGQISWTPQEVDVGQHAVVVRVTDWEEVSVNQAYTLTVLGSPLAFTTTPNLTATVGMEYVYESAVTDNSPAGSGPHMYSFQGPSGMLVGGFNGKVTWTPTAADVGLHSMTLKVRNTDDDKGAQYWTIEVQPFAVAPTITTQPPTEAVLQGVYIYNVNASDQAARESLIYSLTLAPPGMQIDPVTGVIQWIPNAVVTEMVRVRVTDSTNLYDEQEFAVEVHPDTTAPVVRVSVDTERVAVGANVTLTISATDDVLIAGYALSVNGAEVTLDGMQRGVFTATQPGMYTATATVTDINGHAGTATAHFAVRAAEDAVVPGLTLTSPAEDEELTYIHDIVGSVSDATGVFRTTISERMRGASTWTEIGRYHGAATQQVLGKLDTTLLENGYHELRVSVEDLNGNVTTLERPVRVDGQAKVGPVQLSFVDAAIPVAGIPVTVVRSYDSRRKNVNGDFGYGWSLDVKAGRVQHNRRVGEGMMIYGLPFTGQGFNIPCTNTYEQKSHYTEVRLSQRERYIFRPVLSTFGTESMVTGGCRGEVSYELVEGTTAGAELLILDGTSIRSPGISTNNPEAYTQSHPPVELTYELNPLEVFDPKQFRLKLADGRIYDINTGSGITRIEDRNGNELFFQGNGVYHESGKGLTFERNPQGRISKVIEPSGRAVRYEYDLDGNLIKVDNQINESTEFAYHSKHPHHIEKVTGPDGTRLAKLSYDAAGRLEGTCDAEGGCAESSYDLDARGMSQTDATAREVSYTYDERGNVTSQTDALNHTVSFQYDARDNLIRAEGPDGSVATYTYDGSGNMLTRVLPHEANEDPADFTYSYTYTAKNDRATVTLPSGGVIDYDYDARGNQTAVKDGDGNVIESRTYNADGTLATKTDRFGTTVYSGYVDGQPTLITDPLGSVIELDYDNNGRLIASSERGQVVEFVYDNMGRKTSVDYGNGATVAFTYQTGKPDWTRLEGPTFGSVSRKFSASGRLSEWTEPNGDTFTRLYDAGGRVEEEINALGLSTTYDYDAAGRLQAITDVTLGATTTFARDSAGRVIDTTDALNHTTHTAYRLGGRLESTTNARGFSTAFERTPTSSSITDALTRSTTTTLSNYGLPVSTTYPGAGSPSTSSLYDGTTRLDGSQGFPTSFTDEAERDRNFIYDAHSGLSSTTDLAGNAWQFGYAASKGGAISYDVFSGDVNLVHAEGGFQAYGGSAGGTEYRDVGTVGGGAGGMFQHYLDSVTSPMGETTQFVRGANGRIERVEYPDGGVKSVTYGADGQPDSIVLPQGTTFTFTHDSATREVSRVSSRPGEARSFTYGEGDRVETMTDITGTTRYEYDAAGRFSGVVYGHGGSVRYVRDKLGRTTTVSLTSGSGQTSVPIQYTYDANGNLATATDHLNRATSLVYDDVDRLVEKHLPNGVTSFYAYDDRDRVQSVVHKDALGSVLLGVTYERSASGEPTKITREDGSYVVLTYDAALRLDTETYYDTTSTIVDAIDYDYDLDGNRASKNSLSGGFESYTYTAGFRLATISRGAVTETYGYDNGGRLTSIDRAGVFRTLEYNSDDKLVRVTDDGVEVAAYEYDGVGRRVAATESGVTRRYMVAPNLGDGYDTPQLVLNESGQAIEAYAFLGEHPLARYDIASNPQYYLQDAMGTVLGMVDENGALTQTANWSAFGELRSGGVGTAASGGGFGLHGMWLDDASGLYHVRARTYDARTGRFTSRDPVAGMLGRPESMNPYVIDFNNPLRWRDPSGLFTLTEVMVVSAIVGVMAGIALPVYLRFLRSGRVTKASSFIAAGGPDVAAGLGMMLQEIGTVGQSAPLPDYVAQSVRAGTGAATAGVQRAAVSTAVRAGVTLPGSALGEVLIPFMIGLTVAAVATELILQALEQVDLPVQDPANDNGDTCYALYLEQTAYCGEYYTQDNLYEMCMENAWKNYIRCKNGLPPDPLVPLY